MSEFDLTPEHKNILRVLHENHPIPVREIHDELTELDDSRFVYSPNYGDGWNEERREVLELKADLDNNGLVTNDYQEWYLTVEGREAISSFE